MRRQAQDVATNLPSMTNREDLPDTVAVPVELLKELIEIVSFHKGSTPAGRQATALLPKPRPRLVAFNYEAYESGEKALSAVVRDSADLVTLLDEVLEDWRLSTFSGDTDALSARIRTALGVTE